MDYKPLACEDGQKVDQLLFSTFFSPIPCLSFINIIKTEFLIHYLNIKRHTYTAFLQNSHIKLLAPGGCH